MVTARVRATALIGTSPTVAAAGGEAAAGGAETQRTSADLLPCNRAGEDHWRVFRDLLEEAGTAGNLTTDAHLAAIAIEYGAELVSTDTDFAGFSRLRWLNPLQN